MGYVDANLTTNELIVYRGGLHWKAYAVPAIFTALFLCGAALAARGQFYRLAGGLLVLGPAFLVRPYLVVKNSEFVITDKRIIMKVGILKIRTLEMFLNKVENIGIEQTLAGRMLGFGDVTITGSGGTKEKFVNIGRPYEFRKWAQEQISRFGAK